MLRAFIVGGFLFSFPAFVFSNPITWDDVKHFFDFSSVNNNQQGPLEANVRVLIEQQLHLKESGQNLWKAFLYFETKLSFKFIFELNEESGASITLNKFEIGEVANTPGIFYFKVTCNKVFSERKLSEQEIRGINMLFRPCLIKVDDKYLLREQELPFFITLAHELLHALNQLERIFKIITTKNGQITLPKTFMELNQDLDSMLSIQEFLMKKLGIKEGDLCLDPDHKKLWQNVQSDDSLNEMTVILSSKRKISETEFVDIGETTFLREYYNNPTIVSWTHSIAHSSKAWKDDVPLLEKNYVEAMQQIFPVIRNVEDLILDKVNSKEQVILNIGFGLNQLKNFFDFLTEEALRTRNFCIMRINLDVNLKATGFRKQPEYWQFIVFPQQQKEGRIIRFLPVFSELNPDDFPKPARTNFHFQNYTLVDVPADGNCAFTAVKVALGDENFKGKIGSELTLKQKNDIKALREATADLMQKVITDRPNFIQMLRQPGFWNNGIDGAVGIEVLSFVAQAINQPILLITQSNEHYHCWLLRDGYWVFYGETDPKNFLNENEGAVKLFHNGIHFQAIVKKAPLAVPPPPQSDLS